jgi:hypothetical protein
MDYKIKCQRKNAIINGKYAFKDFYKNTAAPSTPFSI